jgi:predicted nucleic acid-binding protein
VVDANVAIKWVLPEIQSQEVLRLLNNDNQLLVPDFFFSEVGNVIWKRICRKEIALEQAKRCLAQMTGTALGVYSSRLLIPQALEIAVSVQRFKSAAVSNLEHNIEGFQPSAAFELLCRVLHRSTLIL